MAEQHAAALYHTLWFHAMEAAACTRGPNYMTLDEAATYDMTPDEIDEYNTWQAGIDFPAEEARHRAVVAACRSAFALWGVELPEDDDVLIALPTWDALREWWVAP